MSSAWYRPSVVVVGGAVIERERKMLSYTVVYEWRRASACFVLLVIARRDGHCWPSATSMAAGDPLGARSRRARPR